MNQVSRTIESLGGTVEVFMRYPDETDTRWSAFNPSVASDDKGNWLMTIRSSNYVIPDVNGITVLQFGSHIMSKVYLSEVDPETLAVSNVREIKLNMPGMPFTRGVEDARLFHRPDGWYFTAVVWEPPLIKHARLCLFKLDPETSTANYITMYEGPRPDESEKNWMPPNHHTDAFDYNYSPTQVYKDGKVIGEGPSPEKSVREDMYLSGIRGGTQLILQEDGTYLACVHDVSVDVRRTYNAATFGIEVVHKRDYTHYFARYSAEGLLTHLTPGFIFKRQGIEYASGMQERGTDLIVSLGAKDIYAAWSVVPKDRVIAELKPI